MVTLLWCPKLGHQFYPNCLLMLELWQPVSLCVTVCEALCHCVTLSAGERSTQLAGFKCHFGLALHLKCSRIGLCEQALWGSLPVGSTLAAGSVERLSLDSIVLKLIRFLQSRMKYSPSLGCGEDCVAAFVLQLAVQAHNTMREVSQALVFHVILGRIAVAWPAYGPILDLLRTAGGAGPAPYRISKLVLTSQLAMHIMPSLEHKI
eukprot:1137172-Pelagomonas_calceolata.AAC.2